jgi:hypothetical protein
MVTPVGAAPPPEVEGEGEPEAEDEAESELVAVEEESVVVAVEVVTPEDEVPELEPVEVPVLEAPLEVTDGLVEPEAEPLTLEVAAATAEE